MKKMKKDAAPVDRRTVLKWMAAGLAAPWMGVRAASEPQLLMRKIPATGEMLPAVGLGTSDEFEAAPGVDLELLGEVLRRFRELGGKLVDTAPAYGNAEEVIGGLVADLGLAGDFFLATKIRARGQHAGIEQMTRSLALLGKQPMDLIQVHSLVDVETQLRNLRAWKEVGRVRYIGVTHSRVTAFEDLERVMKTEPLDFVQLNYSFTEPEAERRLLPLAADKGIAVLVNRPFENGALFRAVEHRVLPAWTEEFDCETWAQFSLKYILANPAVTCVIPATSNPVHMVDNMGAGTGGLPDEGHLRRMREIGASL